MLNFYRFNKSFYAKHNIKNVNYYELTYQPGIDEKTTKSTADIYIDIFVESTSQVKEIQPQVQYQIGWTYHGHPLARKYILGENSKIFALSESYHQNKS